LGPSSDSGAGATPPTAGEPQADRCANVPGLAWLSCKIFGPSSLLVVGPVEDPCAGQGVLCRVIGPPQYLAQITALIVAAVLAWSVLTRVVTR